MKLIKPLSFLPLTASALLAFGWLTGCDQGVPKKAGADAPTGKVASLLAADPREPRQAQPKLRTMKLRLGGESIVAELALTEAQLSTGMMFRTQMAENEGMLFVFEQPNQASFWMKNTVLPLSVAYIDPDGVIREIHPLKPHDTNSIVAATDQVQFALETSQGWFDRHNVVLGTVVRTDTGRLLAETFLRK